MAKRKFGRLHRLVRAVWPWLAGLAVWWGLGWWLDPHPRWRIAFSPGGPLVLPVGQDEKGEHIVAWETYPTEQDPYGNASALLILDATSGKIIHRQVGSGFADSPWRVEREPRLVHGAVWRIAEVQSNGRERLELRVWDYRSHTSERVLRSWEGREWNERVALSPGQSGTFVEEQALPWDFACWLLAPAGTPSSLTTTALALSLEQWDKDNVHPGGLRLCRTWRLSNPAGPAIEPMASWCLPPFRGPGKLVLSPDGQLAAVPDGILPWGWGVEGVPGLKLDPVTKSWRTPEPGVGHPRGVLVYTTRDGQLVRRFSPAPTPLRDRAPGTDGSLTIDSAALHIQWLGQLLLVRPGRWSIDGLAPSTHARVASRIILEGLSNDSLYLFDALSGRRFLWPEDYHVRDRDATLMQHPQFPQLLLQVSRGVGEFSPTQEIKLFLLRTSFRGNRMSLFRSIPIPLIARMHPSDSGWRLFGFNLAINESDEATPEALLFVARMHPSLEKWVRSFWPSSVYRVSAYDLGEREPIWSRRDAVILPTTENAFRQLFTLGVKVTDQGMPSYTSVECWDLPVNPNSPWWARGAGLATVILIVFARWMIGRWRRSVVA